MAHIDNIISRTKELSKLVDKKPSEKIYHKIKRALYPFKKLLPLFDKEEMTIFVVPLNVANLDEINKSERLIESLHHKAKIFHCIHKGLRQIIRLKSKGVQIDKLIIILDDIAVAEIQHEIFHFIYEHLLSQSAFSKVKSYFNGAYNEKRLITKRILQHRETQETEYFAYSGHFFMDHGWFGGYILNKHHKLKRKDPLMYELISGILKYDRELFK